jgi:hypothetical protein
MLTNLTKDDRLHLASLEKKCLVICDRVTLCANGHSNGVYVWGEGGIGNSYRVINQLEYLKVKYVLHNSRLSAASFFQALKKNKDAVHVVEDVENIFKDRGNMNLVRSALWGQRDSSGKQNRMVVWGTAPVEQRIQFDGQIVFTGNRPLDDIPELRAVATRIPIIHLQATRPEILALMKRICIGGYRTDKGTLTKRQCGEVLEYFLKIFPDDRVFSIRVLIRSLDDRIGVKKLGSAISSNWKELMTSQFAGVSEPPLTRKEKLARETTIAIELSKQGLNCASLLEEWRERTERKSLDSYYRRLKKA